MAFVVELSPAARAHLGAMRAWDQQIIADAVDKQLTHEPEKPTRNRKRLQSNQLATWELRVGAFRAFYDVLSEEGRVVVVARNERNF